MLVFEKRASTILFNYLVTNKFRGKFLLPANICPIVPITFLKAGVGFEFVDIDPATYSLTFIKVTQKIQQYPRTISGLVYVHTYGDPTSLEKELRSLKTSFPHLSIVDDRCLCYPDFSDPLLESTDLVLYSTGYGKMIDVGSGGFGFIKDDIAYKTHLLEFDPKAIDSIETQYKTAIAHRRRFEYSDSNWLITSPMVDTLDYKQKVLSALTHIRLHKEQINQVYYSGLPTSIQIDKRFQDWRFSILVPQKQVLLDKIFSSGLFASSHYASLGNIFAEGLFPQAENLHASVINLFNDEHFSIEMAEKVVKIINDHLSIYGEFANVQN